MSEPTPALAQWSLDRKVSVIALVGVLFTVLGAGGGAAMSTGKLENRVSVLEKQAAVSVEDHDRLIRIETTLQAIKDAIEKERHQ